MFGVQPQLGADASEETTNSWDEWVRQHQERLQVVRNLAQKNLEEAAEYRQQHHNQQACDPGFREEQSVYLKDHHCQGRRKIQDVWSPVLYQVIRLPTGPGVPYTITLADRTGNVRRVHRTEMRAAQLVTLPSVPVVPKPAPWSSYQDGDLNSSGDEEILAWIDRELPSQTAATTQQGAKQLIPNRTWRNPGADDGAFGDDPITPHGRQGVPPPQEEMSVPRRTTWATAGKNPNPHNLPRFTVTRNNVVARVGTAAPLCPAVVGNPQFRPWL